MTADLHRRIGVVATILVLGVMAGCAQRADTSPTGDATEAPAILAPMPDHFVADTGAEGTISAPLDPDWSINVVDPAGLAENSVAVVSGRVIGVERSFVDSAGGIGTVYSVQVRTVYQGEVSSDVISVRLPGGAMPLGDYISALDKLGLYEMHLGTKDLDRDGEPDNGPDARTMDPSLMKTENRGLNPASATTLAELQPDFWVFFIGGTEDGAYYNVGWNYGLKYLKDGVVHSLPTEMDVPPFPEAELFEK